MRWLWDWRSGLRRGRQSLIARRIIQRNESLLYVGHDGWTLSSKECMQYRARLSLADATVRDEDR